MFLLLKRLVHCFTISVLAFLPAKNPIPQAGRLKESPEVVEKKALASAAADSLLLKERTRHWVTGIVLCLSVERSNG